MKTTKYALSLLILAILILSLFFIGKEINTKIEQTIVQNYQEEINILKEKLNRHSELINSIININNKENSSANEDENTNVNSQINISASEYEYIKENGGITITKYIGKQTNVVIPNQIEQLPVLKIGQHAFANTKVKSVTLPKQCLEVDWFAFYGCFSLGTVYMNADVTTIGYGAFDGCSRSLTIYCPQESYVEKYAQSFGISYSNYN